MNVKPAKLLLALLLGAGALAFASTAAFADDSKNSDSNSSNSNNSDSKNSNSSSSDSKSSDDGKSAVTSSARCSSTLVSACGLKIVKTTCPSNMVSASTKSEERDDNSHKSKDKDSKSKNDRDYNDDMHKDHADHSRDSSGNKISICHRMGGAEVTLTVANDGWLSGHSKHALDTIGRCDDFDVAKNNDDKFSKESDKDSKISASDAGYAMGLTTTQIACLKGSPNSTYTINGTPYPGADLNSGNTAITLQGFGAGGNSASRSTRGGARTLH